MNVYTLLEMAASTFPERVAVTCHGSHLTYADLLGRVRAAALEVRDSGAERLAVLDESSPALPIGLFAAALAGVPFAPLNYRLAEAELDALLERVSPAYLVTDAERAGALGSRAGLQVHSRDEFLARASKGASAFEDAPPEDAEIDPEAIAILLFTSGTTGVPKAAVLRHRHLFSYIVSSVEFAGADEAEATLVSVPPYHIAGLASVLSSTYSGRRMVQLPRFEPGGWLELARSERVTNAFVVPTMLQRIVAELEDAEGTPLSELRALAYGGGKMPLAVIEQAMALLGDTAFTNAYGLTETSSTLTLLTPDDHRVAHGSDDPEVRRRLTSVGQVLPTVEIEIRDEEGRPVAAGERGEIHVRGEQVSGEYLDRKGPASGDGWFATRDAGRIDPEGYLYLDGRIDDVIVRGGENLSPGEIEDVLVAHEGVADAAVVGVPDEEWGEAVAAVVERASGSEVSADALRDWVQSHLRSSRVPSRIEFRDELPYNETGKLLRRVLREDLAGAGS